MSWESIETYIQHHEDYAHIFAIIIEGEEESHWAWYVIDDEHGMLLASGSDDELRDAKSNAEKAMGAK